MQNWAGSSKNWFSPSLKYQNGCFWVIFCKTPISHGKPSRAHEGGFWNDNLHKIPLLMVPKSYTGEFVPGWPIFSAKTPGLLWLEQIERKAKYRFSAFSCDATSPKKSSNMTKKIIICKWIFENSVGFDPSNTPFVDRRFNRKATAPCEMLSNIRIKIKFQNFAR